MLPTEEQLTEEQRKIRYCEDNQIVEAVPGASKTTTMMLIARHKPNKKILLLGYGSLLKLENREKIKKSNLRNIEAQNIHSFCYWYYDNKSCRNDKGLKQILNSDTKPKIPFDYDIISMDECHDLDPLKFRILVKIIKDNTKGKNTQIILLGDKNQGIFGFLGADPRYLTKGYILLQDFSVHKFVKNKLSKSFRMSKEIANALNFVLGENRIFSDKVTGIKPKYHIVDTFNNVNYILNRVLHLYNNGCTSIYILAPSVKNVNSPIRKLENLLKIKRPDIHVFVNNRIVQNDAEVMENKIVFSTPHPTKGTEREAVILYGFDDSIFKYYYKNENQEILPATYYVAISRAKTHLEVIHHNAENYFEFIDVKNLRKYFDVREKNLLTTRINLQSHKKDVVVTDLIAFLPSDVVEACLNDFEIQEIQEKKDTIELKSKCYNNTNNNVEPVSDFIGLAIPAYFEIQKTGESSILKQVQYCNPNYKIKNAKEMLDIPILLQVVMDYKIECDGYVGRQLQIDNTEWLTKKNLENCIGRFNNLGIEEEKLMFEKHVHQNLTYSNTNICIKGSIDLVNETSVYEFKAKNEIDHEDFLQLLVYAFLMEDDSSSDRKYHTQYKKYYLFNVKTDQLFQISFTFEKLEAMVYYLIKEKYFTVKKDLSDEEFIKNNTEPYISNCFTKINMKR
jgi:hypothetical protein